MCKFDKIQLRKDRQFCPAWWWIWIDEVSSCFFLYIFVFWLFCFSSHLKPGGWSCGSSFYSSRKCWSSLENGFLLQLINGTIVYNYGSINVKCICVPGIIFGAAFVHHESMTNPLGACYILPPHNYRITLSTKALIGGKKLPNIFFCLYCDLNLSFPSSSELH